MLPSCLAAVTGDESPLGLPRVRAAVVVLVDGLGAAALRARSGHARTLAGALTKGATATAVFPSTTAAALTTLATGALPGEHGLVGYSVLDRDQGRVVNQLSGWDDGMDPATWQPLPTVFERAAAIGVPSFAIGEPRFADSGFTAAVLRGAEYVPHKPVPDRFDAARAILDRLERGILYVYVAELDKVAHKSGWESPEWTERLEVLDAAVAKLAASLRPDEGMLVTADHGILDVPQEAHLKIDTAPELLVGVRLVAGEPRCLQLHLEAGVDPAAMLERWREAEGARAWVASRDEVIESGWFGPVVTDAARSRMGDIFVAARKRVVYDDPRTASAQSQAMIGQHGSLSEEELTVPLLRFGRFAR
ncbi:alkaline phosphatase family protein [Lysobacter korlensis]|uniref:Alkaline phosphatase family protein n=1 Tax=Lysobacter korlensis TaxID=553636 RepID=A0ABV6RQ82_9GAMM